MSQYSPFEQSIGAQEVLDDLRAAYLRDEIQADELEQRIGQVLATDQAADDGDLGAMVELDRKRIAVEAESQ